MDPLIAELKRERQLNTIVMVAVVAGLVIGGLYAVAFASGALAPLGRWLSGARNPGAFVLCAVPILVLTPLAYAIRAIARRVIPLPEAIPTAVARPRA